MSPPTLFYFFKIVLVILDHFHFHIFFSKQFKFISYMTDTIFEYLSCSKMILLVFKFYLRVPSSMPVFSGKQSESAPLGFTLEFLRSQDWFLDNSSIPYYLHKMSFIPYCFSLSSSFIKQKTCLRGMLCFLRVQVLLISRSIHYAILLFSCSLYLVSQWLAQPSFIAYKNWVLHDSCVYFSYALTLKTVKIWNYIFWF